MFILITQLFYVTYRQNNIEYSLKTCLKHAFGDINRKPKIRRVVARELIYLGGL